jgi:hypothetical protein
VATLTWLASVWPVDSLDSPATLKMIYVGIGLGSVTACGSRGSACGIARIARALLPPHLHSTATSLRKYNPDDSGSPRGNFIVPGAGRNWWAWASLACLPRKIWPDSFHLCDRLIGAGCRRGATGARTGSAGARTRLPWPPSSRRPGEPRGGPGLSTPPPQAGAGPACGRVAVDTSAGGRAPQGPRHVVLPPSSLAQHRQHAGVRRPA